MKTSIRKEVFLEFLRNLTPQIVILSAGFLFSLKLDLQTFDLTNTKATMPFLLAMGLFFSAFIANVNLFLEKTLDHEETAGTYHNTNVKQITKTQKRFSRLITSLIKQPWLFIQVATVIAVVFAGFLIVFFTAVQTATQMLPFFVQTK